MNLMTTWRSGLLGLALAGAIGVGLAGCDWFEAQPEDNLPPETTLTRCGSPGGVLAGSAVKFTWMGSDVDGDVVAYQWSYDKLGWVETAADSTVIEDVALGGHTFDVRAVDDKGSSDPDPAGCTFAAGAMVERTVLVEFLTTNICRNCPTAEEALDHLLAEHGRTRLAIVAYHDLTATDGLATAKTMARIDWYTSDPGIPEDQWPVAIFDGLRTVEGAVSVDQAISEYGYEISQRIGLGSPVRLSVTGGIAADQGSVEAAAKVTGILSGRPLVMRFVVIEDDVRYDGYFAEIYDAVARDLLEDAPLALEATGDSVSVLRTFPVAEGWTLDNLDVIALIQDTETREIVQAARLRHE